MPTLNKKFSTAASQLGHTIPNVDEGFWNFYRNVSLGKGSTIQIPVEFMKGEQTVATCRVEMLGSPLDLQWVALKLALTDRTVDWDAVKMNHSSPIPWATAEDRMAQNDVAAAYDSAGSTIFETAMAFDGHIRAIDPSAQSPAEIGERFRAAQAAFAAGVVKSAHAIHRDGPGNGLTFWMNSIRQRISRTPK
ncbi:hypothetical protein [Micavibrio aeruginosavorus]|uniref:Uncharacterized protein n=1 Tax=Micavibrio aeruginosavorus (strain ARL-13) TaxID=856793 RepID=G2KRA9_MICAA|nr:hypothetical protein [Micavibrio aeruginosavorus]AEP09156.1 hypothetical protein MICA_823 [Micavibrio aeruginosavorus ARL-13]